eukprot:TRINITY_DN42602_c0_g1_i1.p1 TRINITY_DN42602_c0_g1~~TRINITY_DN42602_c0_g1_i1.p1  ORF type:complete len:497 (+),score=103.74 TRINITY_DN42602_c0_g1_i1:87-1577(+)
MASVDGLDADSIFNSPCMGYNFEDLVALPAPASSDREVDLTTALTRNVTIMSPFVSAPMDTVSEARMAIALALMGGIGVIHSNCTVEEQSRQVDMVKKWESGFIMDPFVLSPNNTIADLDRIREVHDVSSVMITETGQMGARFAGVVTARDIDFVEDRQTRLIQVMTPKAKMITASEPISLGDANKKLIASKKGKLPILNEGGELVAMVTRSDLKKTKSYPRASLDANRQLLVAASVEPRLSELTRVDALVEAGLDVLFLEASQGDSKEQVEMLRKVKKMYPSLDVVAGNVVTPRQAKPLIEAGCDALRVGMGCSTLNSFEEAVAVGRPQGSAVYHVARYASQYHVPVIADGGCNSSSAATMALTLGASAVMFGSLLAGTAESPGDAFYHDGMRLKLFRGMGQMEVMPEHLEEKRYSQGGNNSGVKRLEGGYACAVVDRGPVKPLLMSFEEGVKRDLKRLGVSQIPELHEDLYAMKTRFQVRSAAAFGAARHGGYA